MIKGFYLKPLTIPRGEQGMGKGRVCCWLHIQLKREVNVSKDTFRILCTTPTLQTKTTKLLFLSILFQKDKFLKGARYSRSHQLTLHHTQDIHPWTSEDALVFLHYCELLGNFINRHYLTLSAVPRSSWSSEYKRKDGLL